MASASATETVLLPSLGTLLVTTTVLMGESTPAKRMFARSVFAAFLISASAALPPTFLLFIRFEPAFPTRVLPRRIPLYTVLPFCPPSAFSHRASRPYRHFFSTNSNPSS